MSDEGILLIEVPFFCPVGPYSEERRGGNKQLQASLAPSFSSVRHLRPASEMDGQSTITNCLARQAKKKRGVCPVNEGINLPFSGRANEGLSEESTHSAILCPFCSTGARPHTPQFLFKPFTNKRSVHCLAPQSNGGGVLKHVHTCTQITKSLYEKLLSVT